MMTQKIFQIGLPVFLLWSAFYIFLCYIILKGVSQKMLKPINTLTKRIYKTIKSIRRLREVQEKHHIALEDQDAMYRSL